VLALAILLIAMLDSMHCQFLEHMPMQQYYYTMELLYLINIGISYRLSLLQLYHQYNYFDLMCYIADNHPVLGLEQGSDLG
jgi:hypothetical protein